MLTSVQIVTPPAVEPASIDLVRMHCRVDHSSDDILLEGYLQTARIMAERYLSRALITQTLLATIMPESPLRPSWHFLRGPIQLPRAPVQSISSVTVLDDRGNATTIPPATLPIVPPAAFTGYIADLTLAPAQLRIGHDTVLSDGRTLRQAMLQHVQVTFVAGYGAAAIAIPQTMIQAVLLTTAFLYEHRGDAGGELPQAAQWLLDTDRLMFV